MTQSIHEIYMMSHTNPTLYLIKCMKSNIELIDYNRCTKLVFHRNIVQMLGEVSSATEPAEPNLQGLLLLLRRQIIYIISHKKLFDK